MEAEAEAAAANEISNGELCYVCVLFVTSYKTCCLFKAKSHRISIIFRLPRRRLNPLVAPSKVFILQLHGNNKPTQIRFEKQWLMIVLKVQVCVVEKPVLWPNCHAHKRRFA